MVTLTGDEIKNTINELLERIMEFPEANIENLFEIASIVLAVGLCKKSTATKLLADHIITVPGKIKPLFTFTYQIAGSFGELSDNYAKLAEDSKKQLQEIIQASANAIAKEPIDEKEVINQIEKLRELLFSIPRFE